MLRGRIACLLLTACVVAWAASSAAAAEVQGTTIPVAQCESNRLSEDRTYRQEFDEVEVQRSIAAIPPRTVLDAGPGDDALLCVGFQNRTGRTIDLDVSTFNVAADDDGAPLTTADGTDYGAGEWLELPTDEIRDLPHGDIAWLVVRLDVPEDAASGSWYASVKGTLVDPSQTGTGGITVDQTRAVVSQVFIDIPGERVNGGEIVDARAPRVIWWDGLKVARLPVLDRLRGLGVASVRFGWTNTGTVTDGIDGRVLVDADLGGRKVADLELQEGVVLRGATRKFEATWSRDIPFVGRFTPTIEVTDSTGTVHREELDPIWVIPSWWYLLALALAIGIPVWSKLRSRRRYRELVARVEAAEAGRGEDLDEGSDDGW